MMVVLAGLVAGASHVVSGPDHLAAVAPIAANEPARAAAIGFRWGLGHALGAAVLGGLGIVLRGVLDLRSLAEHAEIAVGLVLIAVGIWALRSALKTQVHTHAHTHDGRAHQHIHVHHGDQPHVPEHPGHAHAALAVGMLHGAAGTGHLLAVVPSLALPAAQAGIYLLAYFVAAVASMTAFGASLGWMARRTRPGGIRRLMISSSWAAIVIGAVWVGTAL